MCVPHKPKRDRLILNRRPANPTERQFGWADQPQGAQLCDGYLKPGEALRGSGQDLSCYFYTLTAPPGHEKRSCVGKVLRGQDWVDMGAEPERDYYLGFRVWPMGDLNSCDVAQVAHEGILRREGLALEENMVR